MELLLNILSDLVHILKFLVICDSFFVLKKCKRRIDKYIVVLATIIVSVFLFNSNSTVLKMIEYCVFLILLIFVIYNESKLKLSIVTFWIVFLVALLDRMSEILINAIFSAFFAFIIIGETVQTVFTNLCTLLFLIISAFILKKANPKGISNVKNIWLVFFMVLTIVDTVVLVFLSNFAGDVANINDNIKFQIFFIFVILGTFMQIASVLLLMVSRNVYAEKEELAVKYLNEQREHYEYLEIREKETKKFRHDLKSHIHMLNMLYQDGDEKQFWDYMQKLTDKINEFGNYVSVSNDIVDAVLNKYYAEAKKYGITLKVKGHFPKECKIEAFDLCIIFSNILSNAIEAERECGGKEVNVSCKYTENETIISCSNDYKGEIIYKDGKIQTKKKNKSYHGWGIENVEECVSKNDGFMNISTENNTFEVVIIFTNEEECNENSNN